MNLQTSLKYCLLFLLLGPFCLTGCADMVEIQERDFVMALGVSAYEDSYEVTFALPNLDAVTGQAADGESDNFIRTFSGSSFPEIQKLYNQNSKGRLDLRHVQAIVFDATIGDAPAQMEHLLSFLNDNYELSHNVLVFYCFDDVKEVMEMEETLGGSIGDYLLDLNKNNKRGDMQNVTIGHLITAQENNRTVIVPALWKDDSSVYLDGCALFQNNRIVRLLDQQESELLHIMRGEGSDYLFQLSDQTVMQINTLQVKTSYSIKQNHPHVLLTIKGTCQAIPASRSENPALSSQLNLQVQEMLTQYMVPLLLDEQIDFLNLYEESSYKQRDIWFTYKENPRQFLKDLVLDIHVDFSEE